MMTVTTVSHETGMTTTKPPLLSSVPLSNFIVILFPSFHPDSCLGGIQVSFAHKNSLVNQMGVQ